MQAVRVGPKRSPDARWFQHLCLLGAVGLLFSWVVAGRATGGQLVENFPIHLLAPPSAPAQDWRPIRVPIRTGSPRDAAPIDAITLPPLGDVSPREARRVDENAQQRLAEATPLPTTEGVEWVQAHRPTALLAAPDIGAATAAQIAQWSYLKVLETRNGWLRVSYGTDGADQADQVAWIAVSDIGASGAPPRFASSRRDTILWNGDGADAQSIAEIPRLATLELAGLERNGRVAVRIPGPAFPEQGLAWVDSGAISGPMGPSVAGGPLARPFSPFSNVQLTVPWRTQLDGSISASANCGPASIAMVLEGFGVAVPISQTRALATRFMGIFSPWTGTTLESLRHVAETYGLVGLDLHEGGRYKRWTLDDVRRHLRAGHPVIPQLKYRLMPGREWSWAAFDHYVVLTGMDGDDFVFNDPAGNAGSKISAQQLLRAWTASDAPGAALAIARGL